MTQGPIYFNLRRSVLETFPAKSKSTIENRLTVGEWLSHGTFIVDSADRSIIVIRAAPTDIASALLTDIELYTNHCFEHIQELICFTDDHRPRSDAWNVVTIYYFSFFAANLLLRLLGKPVLFLTKDHTKDLADAATTSLARPPAGSYYLSKTRDVSSTQAEYQLQHSSKKPHEATWKCLFEHLDSVCSNLPSAPDLNELIFYQTLASKSFFKEYQSYEWPSIIRTRANYRPGYAYQLLEAQFVAKSKRAIDEWRNLDISALQQTVNAAFVACAPIDKSGYSEHVRFLHHTGQSIFLVARQLYLELLERKGIDTRWEKMRVQFRNSMSTRPDEFTALAQPLRPNHPIFKPTR